MEKKSPLSFALLLFFFLLLLASEAPSRAESTRCRAKSRRFQGACSNDRTCSIVCEAEGFELGRCSHLRRLCLFN
ncbi:hypothetical protein HPP92_012771 [Vanilla planifolia]|uniref:Knottins-like domain-containing protein n=1 Tax=Vanilla planifolia TaxID=51239 RepID=A0A835R0M8_VANPL|nr:hypothetical protein HPP92_012771 [Vanilla planifolia]